MPLSLPDPFVGGPIADADPTETMRERFDGVQQNFDAISQLSIDTGGQSVGLRFGSAVVSTPGAAAFFDVTVSHGLGTTPVVVVGNTDHGNYYVSTFTYTATQFTARCGHKNDTVVDPGDFNLRWIAIG
jgi:hypothetical protein